MKDIKALDRFFVTTNYCALFSFAMFGGVCLATGSFGVGFFCFFMFCVFVLVNEKVLPFWRSLNWNVVERKMERMIKK